LEVLKNVFRRRAAKQKQITLGAFALICAHLRKSAAKVLNFDDVGNFGNPLRLAKLVMTE
jgi:hypothetical protein